jgi:hypothetical protein
MKAKLEQNDEQPRVMQGQLDTRFQFMPVEDSRERQQKKLAELHKTEYTRECIRWERIDAVHKIILE